MSVCLASELTTYLPAQHAELIGSSVATAQVGAGSTQGTATAIGATISVFSTVGSGEGAVLPSDAPVGKDYRIRNNGANALLVYPPTSGTINGGSANASVSLTAAKTATFTRVSTTDWVFMLGA